MFFTPASVWQPRDASGRRKYLTAEECGRFLAAADHLPPERRALCYLLAYSGCRVREARALTPHQLDRASSSLTFRTLKRRPLVFRPGPLPEFLAAMLAALPGDGEHLWEIHRATAWRCVKAAMATPGIAGPMASCKGLRHGFGLHAAESAVPPSLIQRWMGHASLSTTVVYLDAVGNEEREFAQKMWPVSGPERT